MQSAERIAHFRRRPDRDHRERAVGGHRGTKFTCRDQGKSRRRHDPAGRRAWCRRGKRRRRNSIEADRGVVGGDRHGRPRDRRERNQRGRRGDHHCGRCRGCDRRRSDGGQSHPREWESGSSSRARATGSAATRSRATRAKASPSRATRTGSGTSRPERPTRSAATGYRGSGSRAGRATASGNLIGVDQAGTIHPNGIGIDVTRVSDAVDTVIEGNVISGNTGGISNSATGTTIRGNKVGTDAQGLVPVPIRWGSPRSGLP